MTIVVCNLRTGLLRRYDAPGGYTYTLDERNGVLVELNEKAYRELGLDRQVAASGGWRMQ